MLLAIDIGNTNIVIGISSNREWVDTWRVQTLTDRTEDEYAIILGNLLKQAGHSPGALNRVLISSVVPALNPMFRSILQGMTGSEPVILDGAMDTGITVKARDPKSVGADLIADAVGAYEYFKETCIVVDFGSATTVMAIEEPGVFLGGAIGSGLRITTDALVDRTAQLPRISLEPPERAIGRNTVEAMQSGLVLGHLCMVEGLITRMRRELDYEAKVIATGGLSSTVAPYTDYFDAVDPMLTLNGIRIIADRLLGSE